MLDLSELPLNQNAVNFLGSEVANNNQSEYNTMTRKIEFDKGIPQSFDFASNSVKTIEHSILSILNISITKIFSRPLHILISLLVLFYIIALFFLHGELSCMGLAITFYVHLILISLELLSDLYSFYQIYTNDKKTNSQSANIYDLVHKCFVNATWGDIRVGHIIKVNKDEIVPADMIILETMDCNHCCYMDYSAITGVFDCFVLKKACNDTQTPTMKTIKFNEYVKNIKGMLKYEEPNSNIHSFTGRLKLESFPRASDATEENFVMRGSTVKNVRFIYGFVVYTGMETKIMQILKHDKNHSNIIKEGRNMIKTAWGLMGYLVIITYSAIILILTLSYIHKAYINSINHPHNDSHAFPDDFREIFFSFIQFLFTFHLIIPFNWFNIALLALLSFGFFIKWDVKILLSSKNTVDVINYDCLSDFGQVKYILTDKTGTLTSRKFVLNACSINGKIFTFDPLDRKDENYIFRVKSKYDLNDLELYQELKSNSQFSIYIKNFFEYLCLCHNVKIRSKSKDVQSNKKENDDNDKVFSSSYAEEKSVLKMMKDFGYCVTKTKSDEIVISANGENKRYHIVGRNKYSDERKRMSIIVNKQKSDGESILLCKGNDLSIFRYVKSENEKEIKMIIDQIKQFSSIGYRFFVFCKKELTEDETTSFMTKYRSAENYVLHRDIHFEILANEFEVDMDFLGVLFFEEKVSPDLRYSVNKLYNSQINVWIVSGDRKENVKAVSKNLDMYKPNSILVEFSEKDDLDDLDIKMNMFIFQLLGSGGNMLKMKTRQGVNINVETNTSQTNKCNDLTMLIHGNCFNLIYNDTRLYQCFVTLLTYTTSLFAYSFTSNHKFLLCQTVKKFLTKNSKVLAIGDGLNDFMMLKEADLSIGIRSREILQVRNTCDVIVTKFPQIVDLILVHGTWNTRRLYSICFFSLYSNFAVIFTFFIHQTINLEGTSFFNLDYSMMTIDILVINIAITLIYCFDQIVERPLIGLNSSVYLDNFKTKKQAVFSFFKYTLKGILDSYIVYLCYFNALDNPINVLGENVDGEILGYTMLHTIYFIIFFKLFTLKLNNINIMSIILCIIAVASIVALSFRNCDIEIVIYQSLSYLPLVLCFFYSVSLCYLYEKLIISLSLLYNPRFMYTLVLKFKQFIDDYVLFFNFDEIIKEISAFNNSGNKTVNKISYQEVMKKIYQHNNGIDSVLDNMMDINNDKMVTLKIKKPFLRFIDDKMEADYMNYASANLRTSYVCYLITMTIFWIVDLAIQSINHNLEDEKVSKILKILYIVSGVSLLINPLKERFFRNYPFYYYLGIFIEVMCIYVEKLDNDTKICIQMFSFFSFPLFFGIRKFKVMILGVLLYYVTVLPSIFINDFDFEIITQNENFLYSNIPLLYHRAIYIIAILVAMVVYGYFEELGSRISFLKHNKKTLEYKKDTEIYSNLVPEFVKEKMKNGVRGAAAIDYEVVTILFCDISDFDKLVALMTPKDMIFLLDQIYKRFDQFCSFHGLQKIETVGKTYMAAGGLKETEKDVDPLILSRHHAVRSFEMSTDMLDYIQNQTFLENGDNIKVKIGLHTGKVIAAVVGNHKPQFSLIGDAINTTARMCAYSQEMGINCSENAYEFISKVYTDCTVSTKEVKGKGLMSLYLFKPFKKFKESVISNENFKRGVTSRKISSLAFNRQSSINIPKISSKMASNVNNNNNFMNNNNKDNDNSVFIFENSAEMPDELRKANNTSIQQTPHQQLMKKTLSKIMIKNTFEGLSADSIEGNEIFNDSFYFLKFNEPVTEDLYGKFSYVRFNNSLLRTHVFNYMYIIVMTLGLYNIEDNYHRNTKLAFSLVLLKSIFVVLLLALNNYTHKLQQNHPQVLQLLTMLIYLLFTIAIQAQMSYDESYYMINIVMEQSFTLLVVTYVGCLSYKQICTNLLIYIIIFVINMAVNASNPLFVKYLVFEIVICLIVFIFLLIREYITTFEYLLNKNGSDKLKNMESLLFNLMPQHVVQNLKEDIPVADVLNNVTVLFADIVRFTDYSSQREPVEVVDMLTELFREFDNACEKFNVYKVHTIGDCYVVMSFTGKVPLADRNYKEEAKSIILMGESMIETIKTVRRAVNFEELNMRIGIHTGTVIAGIIGTKVVRYDIFGSDVLIANKMESGGDSGKICVSEDTKFLLESAEADGTKINSKYQFLPNKPIGVSSLNREINSFFVESIIHGHNNDSDDSS